MKLRIDFNDLLPIFMCENWISDIHLLVQYYSEVVVMLLMLGAKKHGNI